MTTPVKPFGSTQPRLLQRLKESMVRKPSEKPPKLKDVLKNLAESSSLHGVPKLVSSPQIAVKILWSLLFLATFGVLSLQIYTLLSYYLDKPVDTSVKLNFHQLRFPAITVCNMNPVLDSLMDEKYFGNIEKPDKTRRKKRDTTSVKEIPIGKDISRTSTNIARKRHGFNGNEESKITENFAKDRVVEDVVTDIDASTIKPTPALSPEHLLEADPPIRSDEAINKAEYIHNLEILEKRLLYRKPRSVSTNVSSSIPPNSSTQTTGADSNSQPTGSGSNSPSPTSSNSPQPSQTSLHTSYPTSSYPYDSTTSSVPYGSESDWWWNWYSSTSNYDYWGSASSDSSYYGDNLGVDIQEILSGERDRWEEKRKMFQYMFKKMPVENRTVIGHPIDDMILSMTFLGFEKNVSNFKQLPTSEYGNCYTLDSDLFVAWRSGPANGISITMNLMRDEYVSMFASGYGVRILFHESGTFPLPATEGITLSPGTDNNIALKMIHLSRLGAPYGDCSEGKEFQRTFGYKYSSSACLQLCRTNVVISECHCLPFDAPEIMSDWYNQVPICQTKNITVEKCILERADGKLASGKIKCDCPLPCRETVYEKTISWRQWPNQDYMHDVLIEKMCDRNLTSTEHITNQPDKTGCNDTSTEWRCTFNYDICNDSAKLDKTEWQKNFLRVQVYYEDLNFEDITEKPAYEFVRFISDIGGAMGLFMGASILSLVEFLQVTLEIGIWAYERYKRRHLQNAKISVATEDINTITK